MSFYEGYTFFLVLALLLIPAVILGIMQKSLRYYSLFLSFVFIAAVFGKTPIRLLYLISFYLWETGCVFGYLELYRRYGRKEKIYYGMIILSLVPLLISKLIPFAGGSFFCFLGISYLTFKAVQVIIEIYDGLIIEISFVEFTGFLLFFPSLSSGPIDRSRRFHEDWNQVYDRKEYLNLVGEGIYKFMLGIVYKIVLSTICYRIMVWIPDQMHWYHMIGYAYLYGIYMFFDFAGYSLMAVGTSYILGICTPDNFRKPFLSKDIKEFWDRWHITLSYWFRDFIFSRFVMKCTKKKWFSNRLSRASAGFLVNMTIMGAWHGLTPSYLLYGVYHGVLLAITEIYQKKSKFYKKNKKKKLYQVASWFVTMQFVMFGFFIFSGKLLEVM